MYRCLIRLSGHMLNRFDGLSLSKGFLPSESVRISEDFHFNVINVGVFLIGDVPTIVIHNNSKLKIFLLTLIMSFSYVFGFCRSESLVGCLSSSIYITNFCFITIFFSFLYFTRFHSRKHPQIPRSLTS